MTFENGEICYEQIPMPWIHKNCVPVDLTTETMKERAWKVQEAMKTEKLDVLVIYADREHGGNFGYLTGFTPRFEEALLVLHQNGEVFLLLGNEMLRMAEHSRLRGKAIHVPYFSLPNQPMENEKSLEELLREANLKPGQHVGIVGWKLIKKKQRDTKLEIFDVPYFIVDSIKKILKDVNSELGMAVNATGLFIDPANGVRTRMNTNELAFYEYGACLASQGVADVLEYLELGQTEIDLANFLERGGQPNSVQTICAAGERFTNAVVAPRNKKWKMGERLSVTVGYRGGLTNRTAYLVSDEEQLPVEERDYLKKVVIPYFKAMTLWYSLVGDGANCGWIYKQIEHLVPKKIYGWELNPGHFIADEEWLSSPFTKDSEISLKPGMVLQMDLILKVPGYGGCNAEDGVAILNQQMQQEMEKQYPQVWKRFLDRKKYICQVLGIPLKEEVFPMSDLCGYVRPYLLRKEKALCLKVREKE